jgi:hypothetical protein
MFNICIRGGMYMKKVIRIALILIICMVLFGGIFVGKVKAKELPEGFKKNSKFSAEGYSMKVDYFVLDSSIKDVNGDKIEDNIALVGQKKASVKDAFSADIKIVIQDGKSKKYYYIAPGSTTNGFYSKLFFADFNGDKVNDIFVKIDADSSGHPSFYSLISFRNNNLIELFDQEEFSKGASFDVKLMDSFNTEIFCKEANKKINVDASHFKNRYIELGFCDNDGKVLKQINGYAEPYEELKIVDNDKDGIYELEGFQRISATPNKEIIAYGKSLWKYNNLKFNLQALDILPYSE